MRISIQDSLKPIQAGMTLTRDPRPAQYALGFSELEWQGYKALCARVQHTGAASGTAAERSKIGPNAETLDP
jgi:hypothetical protein